MSDSQTVTWYIVKQDNGQCAILSLNPADSERPSEGVESWGPYRSQPEAIARRVGLIRAGKCQPA